MGHEDWGKKIHDPKDARIGIKVDHDPVSASENKESPASVEAIVVVSDGHSKEQVVSALSMMMESVSIPLSVFEELKDDEARKGKVNTLAIEYLEAIKSLDLKKQRELTKSLARILD